MNRKNITGIALAGVAIGLVAVFASGGGELAVRLVGKAVWYLPYVAVVGAVRAFRAARNTGIPGRR